MANSMCDNQQIKNEAVRDIKSKLPSYPSMFKEWKISDIFDHNQNFVVYLHDKEDMKEVKSILKNIGAVSFRSSNNGNALCFRIKDYPLWS